MNTSVQVKAQTWKSTLEGTSTPKNYLITVIEYFVIHYLPWSLHTQLWEGIKHNPHHPPFRHHLCLSPPILSRCHCLSVKTETLLSHSVKKEHQTERSWFSSVFYQHVFIKTRWKSCFCCFSSVTFHQQVRSQFKSLFHFYFNLIKLF